MVLLHVVEKCCRLAERGSGAWARRVYACAVRGRSYGIVLCVTMRSSRTRAFLECTYGMYMTVLSRSAGSDEHVRVAYVYM